VGKALWKRQWICRKTDCGLNAEEVVAPWFVFHVILVNLLAQQKAKISGRETTKYRFLLLAFCNNL
jgi:hypothetical protein